MHYLDPVLDPENEILDLLLDHISIVTETDEALHRATERGAPQWAAQLTAHGANPNHLSPRTGCRALAQVLKNNANSSGIAMSYRNSWRASDPDGTGPRLLKVILEAGVDFAKPLRDHDQYPAMPLIAAVEYGAAWAIPILIKAGADPEPARAIIREHGVRKGTPHAVLALFA